MIKQNIQKIIDIILNIKPDDSSDDLGIDFNDIEKHIKSFENHRKLSEILKKELEKFDDEELLKVYTFYYFGRSFTDGSMSSHYSYFDMLKDFKDVTRDEILEKFCGVQKASLKICFEKAYESFETHESKVVSEKEKYEKRQKLFIKKDGYDFFEFGKRDRAKSRSENIKKIFDDLGISQTDDITVANKILKDAIKATDGLLIVDFLGAENFDHFDFIECDDEVLKLYWKYSQESLDRHNVRVDIKFDILEYIQIQDISCIAIKGLYADKKWIKNYYCNKEKIKQLHCVHEDKHSQFYYDISFDKIQRGGLENFAVSFLPWRYFNILMFPKDNELSVSDSTKILIIKNLLDLENRIQKAYHEFSLIESFDEDVLSMYGNRFRKILESLLKFVLLASNIMYKESYEKDMIGSLLEQMRSRDEFDKKISPYNKSILDELVEYVEKNLVDDLNFCSHDNVSKRFEKRIIEDIYGNIGEVIVLIRKYFKLKKEC